MTVAESPGSWLVAMSQALARISAPADEQVAYLRRLGVAPEVDELGLEFEDLFLPLKPQLVDWPGWEAALAALEDVNVALDSASLEWELNSLESPEWEELRRLAATAQRLVDSAIDATDPPNLGPIQSSKIIR